MPAIVRSGIALILLALPSVAFACTPADPYDYPIRGAYLGVFLAGVMAMTLELFRFRAESDSLKRSLRLASFGFSLVLVVSLLLVCALTAFQTSWQESLPVLPAGAPLQRC